jgi:sensor histidine kinase YesM
MLLWLLVRFYVWAALSPLVVLMSRRFPMRPAHRGRFLLTHACGSIVFSLVHLTLYLPLFTLIAWPDSAAYVRSVSGAISAGLIGVFPLGVLVYWLILGIAVALDLYRRYGQEQEKASRLQTQLLEAQLNALKMQLQPHFLFNTLHSLSDLVLEDPREATRMIARLGDFLRLTLDSSGSQMVSLKTELEFLRCYLEIERVRFQDRLTVHFEVDQEVEPMLVPNLILQPLVENAIRHGISGRLGRGRLDIEARQIDHHVQIQIKDDGPGLGAADAVDREGVGLSNIRERIECLYGDQSALSLQNDPRGGFVATLRLPLSPGSQTPFDNENLHES